MPQLPLLSGSEIIKILAKIGYHQVRQRGSHIRLESTDKRSITVPDYKEIDRSLLRKILRDAEVLVEEFIKLTEE